MKKLFQILTLPLVWLWKFLSTGITVVANLFFLGFLLICLAAVFYTPRITVPANTALVIAPEGAIVEERSPMDPLARIFNNVAGLPLHEETFLQDMVDVINRAAEDQRIKLLVLKSDRMGSASLDQIRTIGAAIDGFKHAGKKVIAFGDSYNQAQYYLASWADKIYMNPMGQVNVRGFSVFRLYMQELLDKLAVNFHVFRVGTYKSALEPFIRNDMSPEDKEANRLWLGNLWQIYISDIAKHRGLTVENLNDNINGMVANLASINGDRSQLALATGLVDGLKTRQEVEAELKQTVGTKGEDNQFNHIRYQQYLRTITPSYTEVEGQDKCIGIITASGNIMYGDGAVGQIGSDDLIRKIRKARENKRVKAIVLRINSGGGSAVASELIRQELLQTKKDGKPVVVSMGAMAASGGYWLAADADRIVAEPVTLTGSIGIFGAVPTVEKTLGKIGIHGDGIGTTAIAHFGNPTTGMSEEEASAFQMEVEHGYRQFLDIVAKGRKLPLAEVEKIAEGRVWDGATALQLGLVDSLGNLRTAVAEAAKLAQIPEENGLYIDELSPPFYLERLKRAEKPVEALVARMTGGATLPAWVQAPLKDHIDILVQGSDPGGLYAHCLLPPPATAFK